MKTILKLFCIWFLSLGALHAKTIKVPVDQATIQSGINAAVDGDTVLVSPGTYVENINFKGKDIVVGSFFLTTDDTSYILQTVIDGNKLNTVVLFEKGETNSAVLIGFCIINGQGTKSLPAVVPFDNIGGGITCIKNSNPSLRDLRISSNSAYFGGGISIRQSKPELDRVMVLNNLATHTGGGIYCTESSPIIKNVIIAKNKSTWWSGGIHCEVSSPKLLNTLIIENHAEDGGGVSCWDNSYPTFENVTIKHNSASNRGGGIYGWDAGLIFNKTNRSNIYLNSSGVGNDLCFEGSSKISVIVDTFTVINPTNDFASPFSDYTFDILHGKIQQVDHDLYISPNGNDNNGGLSPADPLRSISFALSKILADGTNPRTIFLAEGVYKASSGERFPLGMRSFVSISGESESNVILDAEGQGSVLCFNSDQGITVKDVTMTGGSAYAGGAINCSSSNPILKNLTIYKNTATSYGGGIYCKNSNPILTDITMFENSASWGGGGIFCIENSMPVIERVTISRNKAKYWGGAVYSEGQSNPTLINVILWNNTPNEIRLLRGNIAIEYSNVKGGKEGIINHNDGIINWLQGNIVANPLFCNPLDKKYTLAINSPCKGTGKDGLNMGAHIVECDSIFIVENPSTIYVSVDGSDESGSGSYDDPFATVQHAIDAANSGDTILVYPGTYYENLDLNKSGIVMGSLFMTTGDASYISQTILDGDTSGTVLSINNGDSITVVKGFTITHGKADAGGGITCFNSSPILSDIRVIGNTSSSGGGISAGSSKFKLINSIVANNRSFIFGGGIEAFNSYPELSNVIIANNIAEGSGGGCLFSSSVPTFKNVTVTENTAYYNGGGISLQFSSAVFDSVIRCNIYSNHAGRGNDVDVFDFDEGNSNVILIADTFTVKNPTDHHLYRIDKFDILHGKLSQSNKDLYVSPAGKNDNSGESPTEPLRSISVALAKISADSANPRSVFLSKGTYSPSETGEHFPFNMTDYVSLVGENAGEVVLDAEHLTSVLSFDSDIGNSAENLILTGGYRFEGGGIWCENSSPSLKNVAVIRNKAMNSGGGMNCSENSHPYLENCTISDNDAMYGGGIAFYGSCATLLNTILWNNSPDEIYFHGLAYPRSCVEISYTNIMDSTKKILTNNNGDVFWNEGNVISNPLFCNTESGIYSLAENSPCIGAGKDGKNIGALSIGCGILRVENEQDVLPSKFALRQNYPNPFNPTTVIEYDVPKASRVRIVVFDILGRVVETLVDEEKPGGRYKVEFNASSLSSGVYFYHLQTSEFVQTKKLILMR